MMTGSRSSIHFRLGEFQAFLCRSGVATYVDDVLNISQRCNCRAGLGATEADLDALGMLESF